MKRTGLKTAVILFAVLLAFTSFEATAQRGYGQGAGQGYYCNNIPDLTADQKAKITDIRTTHLKKMQTYRNQLAEKRVKLQTLRTSDNVDMKAVDRIIDEMGKIRTEMQKDREQHFQNVRKILTADQRVYFDNNKRGFGYGYGYGAGRGRCGGRAYGYGAGFGRFGSR